RESSDGRLLWYRNVGFLLSSILAIAGMMVMWRRRHPATFLFASLLFAIPLVYYVTYPHPRYRAPIEPEMLVLMVYLFLQTGPRHAGRKIARFRSRSIYLAFASRKNF